MIAYTVGLLTALEDVSTAAHVEVQLSTEILSIPGEVIRGFIRCTNNAYEAFPEEECLEVGLRLLVPELRPTFSYLYEKLKGIIV